MSEQKTISITSGWWGTLLTVAIVAVRAFQPGAEPMSQWSAWSWVMMTIPILWPLWAFVATKTLWLVFELVNAVFFHKHL